MKILVTGAGGFLGSEVVRIATEAGHRVRAMVRNSHQAPQLSNLARQVIIADLTEPHSLPPAVEAIEAVIHCGAATSTGRPDRELSTRVNVEGTRNLFLSARQAGVRRWVQISSMSAHPASTSIYGSTKFQADQFLRQTETPPNWTILQPSLIYGPADKGLVAKTIDLMRKLPAVPIVGSGRELIRPVHVCDVARAALTSLHAEVAVGKTYMLGGADEVELNEFMRRLAEGAGLKPRLIHIPIPICMGLAKLMGIFLTHPPLTVDNVLGVKQARRVDHQPACQDLDYQPMGLREGLRNTFEEDARD
mgnify:CR=1 FL=1